MRKLILITVLMLASASAFAGETRSLTLASNDVTAVSQPTVDRASVKQLSTRLAQAAAPITTQSDAAPTLPQTTTTTTTQTQAPAPVQTAAPATTTQPATTTTTADTKPATTKPATKSARKESDEQKARRIAARYGVHW